jgi:hypothetical protein
VRHHILSAVSAGVITVISVLTAPIAHPPYLEWLWLVINWPVVPAMGILVLLGRQGGPDGLPPIDEAYVVAFLLWWGIIDLGLALWRGVRARAEDASRMPD